MSLESTLSVTKPAQQFFSRICTFSIILHFTHCHRFGLDLLCFLISVTQLGKIQPLWGSSMPLDLCTWQNLKPTLPTFFIRQAVFVVPKWPNIEQKRSHLVKLLTNYNYQNFLKILILLQQRHHHLQCVKINIKMHSTKTKVNSVKCFVAHANSCLEETTFLHQKNPFMLLQILLRHNETTNLIFNQTKGGRSIKYHNLKWLLFVVVMLL